MMGGYADFLYQTGLVDELQREYVKLQTDAGVKLIQQQRWIEAFQVCLILWYSWILLIPTFGCLLQRSSHFLCDFLP